MKLTELFKSFNITEDYYFETKATGNFDQSLLMNEALRAHYNLVRTTGKQIGTAANKYSILQTEQDGDYIIGIYYKPLNIIGAFVKFSLKTLFDKKYIDIILVHSLADMAAQQQILKELVGKNLLFILLDFMKTHYNLPFIEYSGYQSDDAIRAIHILSKNNKIQWLNIQTGQIVNYDPTKDKPKQGLINEPYRSKISKTDWRIIVESTGIYNIDDYSVHYDYMKLLNRGLPTHLDYTP